MNTYGKDIPLDSFYNNPEFFEKIPNGELSKTKIKRVKKCRGYRRENRLQKNCGIPISRLATLVWYT